MNYQYIRRTAVLALAMFLALILSISLTAPGYAGNAGGTESQGTSSDPDATDSGGAGGGTVPVESITLNKTELELTAGKTEKLTADVTPDNATDKTVTWSSSNESVAAVSADGTVTAVSHGTATITAKAGGKTADCEVTVPLTLAIAGEQRWTSKTPDANKFLSVNLSGVPEGTTPTVRWSVEPVSAQAGVVVPTFTGTFMNENGKEETVTGESVTVTGWEVTVNERTAGVFRITAEYLEGGKVIKEDSITLIISGIVLSGNGTTLVFNEKTKAYEKTLEMMENGSAVLSAAAIGDADDRNATRMEWTSDDAYVVSVMPDAGSLNAWHEGEATVYVTKGDYSVYCRITVVADTSAVADEGYTASISDPLTLDKVYQRLKDICEEKTKAMNNNEPLPLEYITNLSVPTDQGTLYYNYIAEADTGAGVGANDRFGWTAKGAIHSVDRLYFVPKQGFSGIAEIAFTGIAKGNRNFAGVIKVYVGVDPDGEDGEEYQYQISYRALAGEAFWFSASDFDAYCRSKNGRSYNYIIFSQPRSSDGALYYNYTVAGSGNPVTTGIRFSQSGQYTIGDVCFVPNAALENNSKVTISFRVVDTSGAAYDGTVTVRVTAVNTGADPSSVTVSGERGRPVTLRSSAFHDACQETINDTLSFVTFKLPDPSEGILYYNYRSDGTYDSRLTSSTRCYYSGVPGLGSVSFVPASGAAGRIAISYTGYGSGGASYNGTLYIVFEEDRSVIYYSVAKGGSVTFSASDFYNAGLYRKGIGVTYVEFEVPDTDLGTLYHNYRGSGYYNAEVYSGSRYYYSSSSSYRLSLISFRAGDSAGIITIPYKAVCGTGSSQQEFDGKVVIQVGSLTPDDVNLSCKTGGYTSASQLALSVYSACSAVMNDSLSYIEITSLPAAKMGHLYYNYNGFGTGTAVTQGDRYYSIGSSNISRLSFVPRAGFSGEAEITYIGYSFDGLEQVSGRILVNVTKSTASQYFTDMGSYTWAIDSVDYLHWNQTVAGIGDNLYYPSGIVTRGDFATMLVNAYGLTATGSVSFKDVPAGRYYTDAIRVVTLLDIVSGNNGYFRPKDPITRQDAMVMIYNTMKISGKATTNGLAADFSAYHDEGQIDPYAREAMGSLIQMGVVTGVGNGYLRPQGQLSRAEAAVLLHTIMTL